MVDPGLLKWLVAIFGPPEGTVDFSRPAPTSFWIGMVGLAACIGVAVGSGWYWQSIKVGLWVFGGLLVIGAGTAIWHSRRRHIAYEKTLGAQDQNSTSRRA